MRRIIVVVFMALLAAVLIVSQARGLILPGGLPDLSQSEAPEDDTSTCRYKEPKEGEEAGPPEPWKPGDSYCIPGEEPLKDADHGKPSPKDDGEGGEGGDNHREQRRLMAHGSSHVHWLGAQTSRFTSKGIYAGLNVIDPDVAHISDNFFTQRVLVKNCDGSRWFEAGWAEFGWSSFYQLQYPHIRTPEGWGFFVNEGLRPRPGERIWIMVRPSGNGTNWGAYLNSDRTQGWVLLSEYNLGTLTACGNEAYVQIDGSATGTDFSFPTTVWGYGGTDGVMLMPQDSDTFQSWTSTISTSESNTSATGRYTTTWFNRYYYWQVNDNAPVNNPPVVSVSVSPTNGDRATTFAANLSGTYDPDGDSLNSLRVDWGDGTSSYPGSVNSNVTHKYTSAGTYSVTGYVCDSKGACRTSSARTVEVSFSNTAPSATLVVSPSQGDTNTIFTASMSGSDPEGDSITYEIRWGDGTVSAAASATHSYDSPGQYSVLGVATDQYGASTSSSHLVTICPVFVQGQCVDPDGVQESIEDEVPGEGGVAYAGFGTVYDTAICPKQWQDLRTAACVHPYMGPAPSGADEAYDAEYLAEEAVGSIPGYCRGKDNPNKYRVLYLHLKSNPNRVESLRSSLRETARKVDYFIWKSARLTGGTRHLRYECNTDNKIKVQALRLPDRADDDSHNSTFRALRSRLSYDPTKRYLIFPDWEDSMNYTRPDGTQVIFCGWGGATLEDESPGRTNANNLAEKIALVYLHCLSPGVVLHEIAHTLGAVLPGAPHYNPEDPGHIKNHGRDPLGSGDTPCADPIFSRRLDCGGDDYFNTTEELPARGTYLADREEYETGKCDEIPVSEGGATKTGCHWNTAWNQFLVGGAN